MKHYNLDEEQAVCVSIMRMLMNLVFSVHYEAAFSYNYIALTSARQHRVFLYV